MTNYFKCSFFAIFYFEYDNGGGQKERAAKPLGGCGEREVAVWAGVTVDSGEGKVVDGGGQWRWKQGCRQSWVGVNMSFS